MTTADIRTDNHAIHLHSTGPVDVTLPRTGTIPSSTTAFSTSQNISTSADVSAGGAISAVGSISTGGGSILAGGGGLLGYGAAATVSVTQETSKSTTVVASAPSAIITTHNATLNDATSVSWSVTNTLITDADQVIVNHVSGGTLGVYLVQAHSIGSGTYKIMLRNLSGGNLGEALVLNATVIKGGSV